MSSPATTAGALAPEPLVAIKLSVNDTNRRFKLPLKDLVAPIFTEKIRAILQVPDGQKLSIERFSDSGNAFVPLEINNASAYKQLYRAGKAKQKLKLKASVINESSTQPPPSYSSHNLASNSAADGNKMSGIAHPAASQQERAAFFQHFAAIPTNLEDQLNRLMRDPHPAAIGGSWQVFCNNCDKPMADAHFHCSICDDGDYDLCQSCVNQGASCQGEEHWLIKRFIKDGKVVNSTTETIAPRSSRLAPVQHKHEMPGTFKADLPKLEPLKAHPIKPFESISFASKPVPQPINYATRTCNGCVRVLPEDYFVTCEQCDDIDYCIPCMKTELGHHPAHSFKPAVPGKIVGLTNEVNDLCKPNRNVKHFAICDICDQSIQGVRHKCLTCPDFDVCSQCYATSAMAATHNHRFVPVYEPLALPTPNTSRHYGIYCDGPLCNGKPGQTYISGVRYKCAVCADVDFCGNCEAHPSNKHNETHPLIKFKTPVRGVSVQTIEHNRERTTQLGDILPVRATPARPMAVPAANASSSTLPPYSPPTRPAVRSEALDAHFVKDSVTDGTAFGPNKTFTQTWAIRNPGPHAWPAGVAVHHIGGDNMLNIDRSRPTTVSDLKSAQRSARTVGEVKPGETQTFQVTLQAPARAGKHISYWRLKAPDGTPFGHKLWCDIEVKQREPLKLRDLLLPEDAAAPVLKPQTVTFRPKHVTVEDEVPAIESTPKSPPEKTEVESKEEPKTELNSSTVIMPTILSDGSPSNSIHSDAVSAATTNAIEPKTAPESVGAATETKSETESTVDDEDKVDVLDDVEFQSADDGSVLDASDEDEDGFLTDEEYDILDASDEEARI